MHFRILTGSQLCIAVYFFVYVLSHDQGVVGCRGGLSQQQDYNVHSRSQDPAAASVTITTTSTRLFKLNTEDSLYAVKTNIRAKQGDQVFGRLFVPEHRYGDDREWTLTVMASWGQGHYTSPLWIFLKKTGLPTKTSWDKTSISFVSRKFSRIRLDNASPGPYYVMIEALTDLYNVTMTVSITPMTSLLDDFGSRRIEENLISHNGDGIP